MLVQVGGEREVEGSLSFASGRRSWEASARALRWDRCRQAKCRGWRRAAAAWLGVFAGPAEAEAPAGECFSMVFWSLQSVGACVTPGVEVRGREGPGTGWEGRDWREREARPLRAWSAVTSAALLALNHSAAPAACTSPKQASQALEQRPGGESGVAETRSSAGRAAGHSQ